MQTEAIDINQIDEETEFVLDKFREGHKSTEIKTFIKNFIEARLQQSFLYASLNQFKPVYFLQKKLEKVVMTSLKNFGQTEKLFAFKELMIYLLDNNQTVSPKEKTAILRLPVEVQAIPKQDEFEFYSYLLRMAVQVLNNIGVVMILRNKIKDAQSYFTRGLAARSYIIESLLSQYQMTMLLQNLAFSLNNTNEKEDAKQFLNKSILNLENLSQPENDSNEVCLHYNTYLSLLKILNSKREQPLLQDPREIQKEKMVHLLALSYHYYSELLQSMGQQEQSKFCMEQFKYLSELFMKLNPRAKLTMPRPSVQKEAVGQEEVQIAKHTLENSHKRAENFSSITVKSQHSGGTMQNPPEISEDKIVFSKYIVIKERRFKVIILQFTEYLQIILYSKPLNFLQKLIIMYDDLIEYQKKVSPSAFEDERALQEFFKLLIKKLYLVGNELHLRDLKHFRSIEEVGAK